MKIGYLVTRLDEWGGAQVHVRDLALWMAQKGHDVHVFSGAPGVVSKDLQDRGIAYTEIPSLIRNINPLKEISAFLELRRTLKSADLDLLTCHSSKAGILGRFSAWSIGLPVVFTAHNWTFGKGVSMKTRPVYWLAEALAAQVCDHIITVSGFGRKQALAARIATAGRITAIPNGMPDDPARAAPGQGSPPVRITMIARIGWPKRHDLVLEALAGLRNMEWQINFVGGGDSAALKERAKKLDISNRVHFLGERRDIPHILTSQTDIFVLASDWEGFPLCILEAMRAGLPVVASDVGGISESVHDHKTGILVTRESVPALRTALKSLIEDPALRATMGAAGRRLYEDRFTFDVMATQTLAVYEEVLAERRAA